jgi:hypothetical protein
MNGAYSEGSDRTEKKTRKERRDREVRKRATVIISRG